MFLIENSIIKFSGAVIFLTAIILFLFPFQFGVINIGNIFGLVISGIMFMHFAFNRFTSGLLGILWQNKAGKVVLSSFLVFLAAGFITAAIISGFMIKAALNKPASPMPAILLGCKVNGTEPSLMLRKRINAACKYLSENESAVIIVSGGQGPGEDISEAECMKRCLVKKGISADRIITETNSTDTYQNIEFSKKYLDEYDLGNEAVIVTDSFHQLRASMIAEKFGLRTSSAPAHTTFYLLPTYWVREWFGIMEQIFLK